MATGGSAGQSCDGSESSITACYGGTSRNSGEKGGEWSNTTSFPCGDKLIVGCSESLADTWVIGDRAADALSARPRKVFAATDGPYNCETRKLWAEEGLGGLSVRDCRGLIRNSAKTCWGLLRKE